MSLPSGPWVFDASAIIALLANEPGGAIAESRLDGGILSVVNLAEVLAKLADGGTPPEQAERLVLTLRLDLRPMDINQARRSAQLRTVTRRAGLSLGDRACLALATELGCPVLTTDRQWSQIAAAVGVTVELIR